MLYNASVHALHCAHKQVLAGANAEVCYSKYGSMPTKVSLTLVYSVHSALSKWLIVV
jgi:hypothetical protein